MKKTIIALLLNLLPLSIFAADHSHMFTGSSNSSIFLQDSSSGSYEATLNIEVGYDYLFESGLELGGTFSTILGDNFNFHSLLIGPGFNFGSKDAESAYFVNLRVGILAGDYNGYVDTADFMWTAQFGKRFQLANNISYVPGIQVSHIPNAVNNEPNFSIELFRFSLFF